MELSEFLKRMGLDPLLQEKWQPFWQKLLENTSDEVPDFMKKDFYTKYYPLCKGPENESIFPLMSEISGIVSKNPYAARYARIMHYAMFLAPHLSALPFRDHCELFGKNAGIFHLMVALSALPLIRNKHKELNLPETYMHGIAKWIGGTIKIYAAAHEGYPGHSLSQTHWLRLSIKGELFRIGRLEFLPGMWPVGLPAVYRNRNTRKIAVLCRDGWAFDQKGFQVDPLVTKPYFLASLKVYENQITGTPITPFGFPEPEKRVTLDLSEWEPVCAPWEKNLTIHIPGGSGLSMDAIRQSMKEAIQFFRKTFGNEYRIFTCTSWLFNPAWQQEIPDSNIAQWQREVFLTPPNPPEGMPGYFFVYGVSEGDPRKQPVTSSLHKAFCRIIDRGEPLRWGGMFFLAEDIDHFGTEYYRKNYQLTDEK